MQRFDESKECNPGTTNTVEGYSVVDTFQTRRDGTITKVMGVIDDTEGLGAMDTLPLEPGTRNFDIGGGKFNSTTMHLLEKYGVKNFVYDPYNRSKEHNERVLEEIKRNPVDSVTSNSVLNVILDEKQRKEHIELANRSLKSGGYAFFKVWRGNGTEIPEATQSNKAAIHYFSEICDVFGDYTVSMANDDIGNTIIARKR